MCKGRPGLPSASDSPTSSNNSEKPQMDTHLIVNTATLCVVVAIALLFLAFRAWQKRETALSVQSKGTQTDNPILNIDSTINRLSLEVSTLQQRLESIEQGRLEALTNNRLQSSMLPKSAHFTEEDESFDQNHGTSFNQNHGTWSSSTNTYPAV